MHRSAIPSQRLYSCAPESGVVLTETLVLLVHLHENLISVPPCLGVSEDLTEA